MALLDPPATDTAPDTAPAPAPEPGAGTGQPFRVVHLPQKRRFVIEVGGRRAGFTEYFESGERRAFVHTEIGQPFSGRGLASALVREALTTTRADGKRVVAMCPYVSRWLAGHTGFEDLVDAPRP